MRRINDRWQGMVVGDLCRTVALQKELQYKFCGVKAGLLSLPDPLGIATLDLTLYSLWATTG